MRAVAALVLMGVYLMSAFGVRSWLHRRRVGDAGWRGRAGRPLSVAWWAGALFAAALAAGVVAPVAALIGMPPFPGYGSATYAVAGLLIGLVGIGLALLSQEHLGRSWRVGVRDGERTELVTTGLFGVVRNPFFAATCLVALGVLLLVPNVIGAGGWLALVVALQLQVRMVEEPHLLRTHVSGFAEYAACTGRFVPGTGLIKAQTTPLVGRDPQPEQADRRAESPTAASGLAAHQVAQLVVLVLHGLLALALAAARLSGGGDVVLPLVLAALWLVAAMMVLRQRRRSLVWSTVGLAVACTPLLQRGTTASSPSLPQMTALGVLLWGLVAVRRARGVTAPRD